MSNCRVVDFKGRVDIVESSAYWIFSSEVKFKSRVRTCICCVAMFKTLALCDGTPKCYVLYLKCHMLWIASAVFLRAASPSLLCRIIESFTPILEMENGGRGDACPKPNSMCQRLHFHANGYTLMPVIAQVCRCQRLLIHGYSSLMPLVHICANGYACV